MASSSARAEQICRHRMRTTGSSSGHDPHTSSGVASESSSRRAAAARAGRRAWPPPESWRGLSSRRAAVSPGRRSPRRSVKSRKPRSSRRFTVRVATPSTSAASACVIPWTRTRSNASRSSVGRASIASSMRWPTGDRPESLPGRAGTLSISAPARGCSSKRRAMSFSSHRVCWPARAKNSRTVAGRASRRALSSRSTTALSISSACRFNGGRVSRG